MKKFMIEIKLSSSVDDMTEIAASLSASIDGIVSESLTRSTDRMTNQIIISVPFATSSPEFDIYDLQDKIEDISDEIEDVEISPVLSVEISDAAPSSPPTISSPLPIPSINTSNVTRRRKRKSPKSSALSPKKSPPPAAPPVLTKKQLRANRALSSVTLRAYLESLSTHLVDTIKIPPASWGSTPPRLMNVEIQHQPATFPSDKSLKLIGTLHSGTSSRPFDDFSDEYEWFSSADPSTILCHTQVYTPQFSDIGHTLTCRARIHPCASKSQQKLRASVISKKNDSSSDYLSCDVTTSLPVSLSSEMSDLVTSFLYVSFIAFEFTRTVHFFEI